MYPVLLLIPQRYEFSSKSQPIIGKLFEAVGCCWYHKGTNFQANHNGLLSGSPIGWVVADTTKVRIFKQITTDNHSGIKDFPLLLIPQRYEFSSKSQLFLPSTLTTLRCCWYHKGTNFQANHNILTATDLAYMLLLIPQRYEFSSKSQPYNVCVLWRYRCCWYHKGTNFQANHNQLSAYIMSVSVVADTTKVRIFKQITTFFFCLMSLRTLLLIPQRYEFSSKSQRTKRESIYQTVVADTTKVRIFKQITTIQCMCSLKICCCWYHKGTNFQANHNICSLLRYIPCVVADTTKVRIFKQITTRFTIFKKSIKLLLIPQRYEFSSKSQPFSACVT